MEICRKFDITLEVRYSSAPDCQSWVHIRATLTMILGRCRVTVQLCKISAMNRTSIFIFIFLKPDWYVSCCFSQDLGLLSGAYFYLGLTSKENKFPGPRRQRRVDKGGWEDGGGVVRGGG